MSSPTAASCGYALCEICETLGQGGPKAHCQRCGSRLHARKPGSVQRAWALLIAAYALYIPANLLPIMETRSLFGVQRDTILSGVVYLWESGSWALSLIVFIASIAVPMLKLLALTLLLLSVSQLQPPSALARTRVYRVLELIGRWSMLDVYVVAILVALVQAQALATIVPGPGVVAFGAVVVLSMLATMSFDPRLIWDSAIQNEEDILEPSTARNTAV
jgi:paraquat-inducible protein A